MHMNSKYKLMLVGLIGVLIGSCGTYVWQASKPVLVPYVDTEDTIVSNMFAGVIAYNCEKSGGSFDNNRCVCPIEAELGQTQESMYDKNTGYCQTTFGGPGGEAFNTSIGLPAGDYGYYNEIIQNLCLKSGGDLSGAACICPVDTQYDKSTGYCTK